VRKGRGTAWTGGEGRGRWGREGGGRMRENGWVGAVKEGGEKRGMGGGGGKYEALGLVW